MDTITISGHANYSDSNDIVCASVSSIMYTTVNAIMKLNHLKKTSKLMPGQILKYN